MCRHPHQCRCRLAPEGSAVHDATQIEFRQALFRCLVCISCLCLSSTSCSRPSAPLEGPRPNMPSAAGRANELQVAIGPISTHDGGAPLASTSLAPAPDLSAAMQREFPPANYFVWANSGRPIRTFPQPNGAIATSRFRDDPHAYGFYGRRGDPSPQELPEVGIVNLNRDARRRWGIREGGSESDPNFANKGTRYVVGAGVFRDGDMWLAFQTEATPSVVDVYVQHEDHWKLTWSTYPKSTTWIAAASRVDIDGLVAIVAPPNYGYNKKPMGFGLLTWDRSGRVARRSLGISPAEYTPIGEQTMVSCFDDGTCNLVACDSSKATVFERVSLNGGKSFTARFPDVVPCAGARGQGECHEHAKQSWGSFMRTANEFLLWHTPGEVVKFNCEASQQECNHQVDAQTTKAVQHARTLLDPGGCGLEILSSEQLLLNVRHGPDWYLLSNVRIESECPKPPGGPGVF